jgi:hypothetical protein
MVWGLEFSESLGFTWSVNVLCSKPGFLKNFREQDFFFLQEQIHCVFYLECECLVLEVPICEEL